MKKIFCDYCGDQIEEFIKEYDHSGKDYDVCKHCHEEKNAEMRVLETEFDKKAEAIREKWRKKMETAIEKCPSCHGKSYSIMPNGSYVCKVCDTRWLKQK